MQSTVTTKATKKPKRSKEQIEREVREKLESKDCELVSIEPKQKVIYICRCGDEYYTSVHVIDKPSWGGCKKCNKKPPGVSKKVKDRIIEKLTSKDCVLIYIGDDKNSRRVKYQCSCGEVSISDTSNIGKDTWNGCIKCSNSKRGNINTIEYAQKVWKEGGETLPDQPYVNNKTKLRYICSNCNKEAHTCLHDFKRSDGKNRRCENCAKDRAGDTNQKKYGHRNVLASEHGKQKMKETNQLKRGVDHHMKDPAILQKVIDTNLRIHGIAFAFLSEESFKKARATCVKNLGVEFPLQSKEIRDKCIKTCFENYGVYYPLQSAAIQEKIMQTFRDRYDMEKYEYLHSPEIRQKADETCMARYGATLIEYLQSAECRAKADATCMERYGMTLLDFFCSEEFRVKARATCLKKFGVEYPAQCEKIFHKMMMSGYTRKKYVFPSGRIEYCQGYEPRCFDFLLKTYEEDDIVVGYKGRKEIWYNFEGKKHRYYPDGFIISKNAVLEVKSVYYYKKDYERNNAKFDAVVKTGLNLLLYVFDSKGLESYEFRGDDFHEITFRVLPQNYT